MTGLTEIDLIENDGVLLIETSTNEILPDDYIIWFIVGGILVIIVVFAGIKFLKNKN